MFSLKIRGQKFDYFNKFKVVLAYNSVASVFSFEGLVINDAQKTLFKPFQYHPVEVFYNDELILTGTGLNTSISVGSEIELGSISGYSKPGVLEDCPIPISLQPVQFDGMTLKEIAEKIIEPFGLALKIDDTVKDKCNEKYTEVSSETTKSIKDFICDLAKQKNIIVSHDKFGNLLFTSVKASQQSIATYIEGKPTIKIDLSANGQALHSEITVQNSTSVDSVSTGEETVKNNLVKVFRPTVKKQTSGENNHTEMTAKMVRASELGNAVKLSIETDRWTWYDGKKVYVISPNKIIEVESPSCFISKRSKFFVEQVEYMGDTSQTKASMIAVLPEVYTGETPKNIFE